jgi:hypothetical protein
LLIASCAEELRAEYERAVRRAILDYVITCESQRCLQNDSIMPDPNPIANQPSRTNASKTILITAPSERQRLMLEPLAPLLPLSSPASSNPHSAAPKPASHKLLRGSGGAPSGALYHLPAFSTSAAAAATRQLPPEWAAHVAASREEIVWSLQTLNPGSLELMRLWYESGYVNSRLVDVTSAEFHTRLPAQVSARASAVCSRCSPLIL